MLDKGTWLPAASALPPGRRARVDHYCGPGRTLLIRHDNDGQLHAWCFRCNDGGHHRPERSTAELLEYAASLRAGDGKLGVLLASGAGQAVAPSGAGCMDGWPSVARLWLYRAGIGKDEAAILGAWWDDSSRRVVLPVRGLDGWDDAGSVVAGPAYYQARACEPGRQPKYLGGYRAPSFVGCFPPQVRGHRRGPHQPVVLTEDILSAFKVSLAGTEAWPIMGTSVPASYVSALLDRTGPVITWTDPDPAGRKAAARYGKQLRAYGVDVRDILSSRDPKLHFIEDIQCLIKTATTSTQHPSTAPRPPP